VTEAGSGPGAAALRSTDFAAAIRANERNTFWLCAVLILLGTLLGAVIGAVVGAFALPATADAIEIAASDLAAPALIGAGAMLSLSLVFTFVGLQFGGSMVVGLMGARAVTPEREPKLTNVVEEMSLAAGLTRPRMVVIETPALNAFATGTDAKSAVIGVTRGLLDGLERDELQGVVAHEMGHIANRDILYMTAVATLVGLIVMVCDVGRRVAVRGLAFGGGRGRKGNPAALIALAIFLVFAVLAPIAALLLRMAVSRQREYLADATAVKLTRNPLGLIGALEKIGASSVPMAKTSEAVQHLFISNPLHHFGPSASALFSTHPPIERRIERLRDLG
jgi:heat shock protein HtpX